ncbi:MAG: hypothetical protein LBJ72_13965 [Dysgonamonadaceae bacterium]|jgi:hypothetical protein|nr:hypothetical protein [Dysgonamonadaceae bacterium]
MEVSLLNPDTIGKGISERQQRILDEILQLQKDQNQLLANIHSGMKPTA